MPLLPPTGTARDASSFSAGATTSLLEIQRAITGALFRRLGPGERMQRSAAEVAARHIKPNERLSALERLEIYNQQYWWRILGNFREDYRGLHAVLGERKFERLAIAYLENCGSTSWNLRDVGQHLAGFLQAHPELTAPHSTLALEMAQVEWARVVAFDGPERSPIDPAKLGPAPERQRFALQPYLTLLELSHPIDRLLGGLRRRSIETGSVSNAVSGARKRGPLRIRSQPSPERIFLAVHRLDLSVYYKRLEPEAFRLLAALQRGAILADACEEAFAGLPATPPDAADRIRAWFGAWTRLGWLVWPKGVGRRAGK